MAKADEIGRREAQKHVSMQVSNFPKYPLQRFVNGNQLDQEQTEQTKEIELSLGLSLNGRFGEDPTRANNNLTRSSSIPDFVIPFGQNEASFVVSMACADLLRTCSLPTETEEEWRKRKELQTLRRMEAKRKRSEKQRNLQIARGKGGVSAEEIKVEEDDKREEGVHGSHQMENWVIGGTKGVCAIRLGRGSAVEGGILPPASQGSNGSSLESGSSGISKLERQPPQGPNKCTEAVTPSRAQSMSKNEHRPSRNLEVATTGKSVKSMAAKNNSYKSPLAETRVEGSGGKKGAGRYALCVCNRRWPRWKKD